MLKFSKIRQNVHAHLILFFVIRGLQPSLPTIDRNSFQNFVAKCEKDETSCNVDLKFVELNTSYSEEIVQWLDHYEDMPDECRKDQCGAVTTDGGLKGEHYWPKITIGDRHVQKCKYHYVNKVVKYFPGNLKYVKADKQNVINSKSRKLGRNNNYNNNNKNNYNSYRYHANYLNGFILNKNYDVDDGNNYNSYLMNDTKDEDDDDYNIFQDCMMYYVNDLNETNKSQIVSRWVNFNDGACPGPPFQVQVDIIKESRMGIEPELNSHRKPLKTEILLGTKTVTEPKYCLLV
ncbi:hypothetical protein HELRODRAFT_179397 [Helobdella robusta]|uniref:Uncharacterized protein n=1 Tax=Helobdella robusta TaxID=6412 RepID=T1FEN2_HELRO|nr:hypothetical protein HELRODRAFT_179397 [Helobdella robusta]ESN95332.1 hypothetical protein HELRODRAFT_179397 [Helobdella robusta]